MGKLDGDGIVVRSEVATDGAREVHREVGTDRRGVREVGADGEREVLREVGAETDGEGAGEGAGAGAVAARTVSSQEQSLGCGICIVGGPPIDFKAEPAC